MIVTVRPPAGWRPTWTLQRTCLLLVVLCGLALAAGRPALALAALPLAVGTAAGWAVRPSRPAEPWLEVETPPVAEQGGSCELVLGAGGLEGAQSATVRLPDGIGAQSGRLVVLAAQPASQRLTLPLDASDPGVREIGRAGMRGVVAPDVLLAADPVWANPAPMRVLPAVRPVPAAELPARAAGQVGEHRTRRPGDGSELLDIREFRPGDRLRRIDWRVSARRGALHVRRTAIDAEADLVICLDTRFDLGPDIAAWASPADRRAGEPSSLDTAVSAAASLAGTYLRLGDRVGLVDLNMPRRSVRPASGHRQLMRIRWQLAGVSPEPHQRNRGFHEGVMPSGAVVAVLSPFLDEEMNTVVGSIVRTGRDVVAVDVLPATRLPADRRLAVAARLVLAERTERLAALARRGVLVTPWDPALLALLMRRREQARRRLA